MRQQNEHIGYIERDGVYTELYSPGNGSIVTTGFIFCKYCKDTLDICAGPNKNAVCNACYDKKSSLEQSQNKSESGEQ